MLTQAEAAKYTVNAVKKGVLEEIIKDSVVLQNLPFIDVVGNAYQYLRDNTLSTNNFYSPNELWSEDSGDNTQVTAVIKIMGGDADIDNFLKQTRSDKTDFEAEEIAKKAKSAKHKFLDTFWYGNTSTNAKAFDGTHVLLNTLTGQLADMGAAAMSVATLESTMDLVKDGMPDGLWMPKGLRRRLTQFIRASSGGNLQQLDIDKWGNRVQEFNGVPIYVDDFLTFTETVSTNTVTAGTGGSTASVLILTLDEDAVCGLQNGGLDVFKIGQVQDKDAVRWRIRWYCGEMIGRAIRNARLNRITDVAVV